MSSEIDEPPGGVARFGRLRGAAVRGLGSALPETTVDNAAFAHLGLDDAWLRSRTGIASRRRCDAQDGVVALGTLAGAAALTDAGVSASEVDVVVVASISTRTAVPPASALVAHALGAGDATACDLVGSCCGFLSGVAFATGMVESGRADNVLVVGAEQLSRMHHAAPEQTAPLPGDGAGAVLVVADTERSRIGPVVLRSDGGGPQVMRVTSDRELSMDGAATFAEAVPRRSDAARAAAAAAGTVLDDVDLLVLHQASGRITQAVGRRLGFAGDRLVDCIETLGNTSSASIPIALDLARADGRLRPGTRVVLAAFGGGLVWGGVHVEWTGTDRPGASQDRSPRHRRTAA